MAARVTWVLLWPTLLGVGFFAFTVWALTCGDDGLVDYGGEDIWGICDSGGTAPTGLWLGSAVPLAVLGLGAGLWDLPRFLRWVNGAAFVLAGVVAGAVAFFATAYGATVIVAVIWLVVLAFAVLVAAVETGPRNVPSQPLEQRIVLVFLAWGAIAALVLWLVT